MWKQELTAGDDQYADGHMERSHGRSRYLERREAGFYTGVYDVISQSQLSGPDTEQLKYRWRWSQAGYLT